MKTLIAAFAVATLASSADTLAITREQLTDYYATTLNLKSKGLKTALYDIIKNHKEIDYGTGTSNSTWWAFYSTDQADGGVVVNRYSDEVFYFGRRGNAVSGMNIEHSFPKSWWGGGKNAAYKDLFNLYPSPSDDNSQKSNYPMGRVTDVKFDSGEGFDKVGYGTVNGSSQMCWEPGDGWKGDFARAYMYMAVCYQNLTWVKTGLQTLQCDTWPTLRQWAQDLYICWSGSDKVDSLEASRNEAVYGIQKNRNPFVDFPFLCEYVWGDSVGISFDPRTAISTASDDPRYGSYEPTKVPPAEESPYIYYADCKTNFGNMTTAVTEGPLNAVWTKTEAYGWKASAYSGGKANASEATLTTPEIDLTDGYKSVTLTFEHAVKFAASPSSVLSVEVEADGVCSELEIPTWPVGDSWDFANSGDVSLDNFIGKKIRLIFRYTSTASEASTWEVREVKVSGDKMPSALRDIVVAPLAPDWSKPYEVYSIDGHRISGIKTVCGLSVVVQGGHSWLIRCK